MASASLQYTIQIDVLVQLDGSNWMSVALYPGMWPGSKMACTSA